MSSIVYMVVWRMPKHHSQHSKGEFGVLYVRAGRDEVHFVTPDPAQAYHRTKQHLEFYPHDTYFIAKMDAETCEVLEIKPATEFKERYD